ncbi:WD domain, G-beta repeat domain containing protein [Musa troglodytarum]|uniref:WD domain, G-beta repeat domain containing protein n=1 Tax=Musa troglodytarum TaxID=320322 RepID=A0A9E7EEP2_9LILI|nr:WD domain, G-beta repeat domain containing protein [Musa troglodytarum]
MSQSWADNVKSSSGSTSQSSPHLVFPHVTHTNLKHRVEAESLRHLSAKYSPLVPPPRSTIAAAFSSDGNTIASTHGDHTVKIIDCQTGNCLKVLSGHRRTPWVVRFHPLHPEKLASGSLDHEVRLWDTETADYRPIASIAFHAQGELLAVASGHKLYIWNYNKREEASSPTVVLKTRRSLRAVHFHPHGAPFLLTAEVNDLDSPDSPLTLATSSSFLHYPPPTVLLANLNSDLRQHQMDKLPLIPSPYFFWPTFVKDDGRTLQHAGGTSSSASGQPKADSSMLSSQRQITDAANQYDNLVAPMDISPGEPSDMNFMTDNRVSTMTGMDKASESVETNERQSTPEFQARISTGISERLDASGNVSLTTSAQIRERSDASGNISSTTPQESGMVERVPIELGIGVPPIISASVSSDGNPILIPFHDPPCWELPLLQGWLMSQTHSSLHTRSVNGGLEGNSGMIHQTGSNTLTSELQYSHNAERLVASSMANLVGHSRVTTRSGSRHRSNSRLVASTGVSQVSLSHNSQTDDAEPRRGPSGIGSEVPTSLAAAAAVELPCTVKLRIWPYDIQDPCAPLELETCRLTIPHAVLCSEMGTHFSPCGRFLVACVACLLPHVEGDPGTQSQMQHDASGAATSPTQHPISAQQVMYELRIYSLEEATFGMVLSSRAIRAAHCLTSIQFSPTSEHILLAYGRRHNSLLRSIVADGETAIPIYTILEVYRVSDMELVRVLPSMEDEVNVACFHPSVGGGLVYGTKEGKLRILQYDGSDGTSCMGPNAFIEENMLEMQIMRQMFFQVMFEICWSTGFQVKLINEAGRRDTVAKLQSP